MRGPLHGIPIALKDNMHTTDMPTTGGALAFDGLIPPYEATLTKNLRDAGAIIIAKTTMTELANWVAGGPTPMPGGYNGLIGYSMNPYDPRRDPRRGYVRRPSGSCHRRIELRRGHGCKFLGGKCGQRNVRLDSEPIQSEHARGHQADRGPHQPVRHYSDYGGPGYGRPDGQDRHRRGHSVRRSRERHSRSERSGHAEVRSTARARLPEVSQARRPQRSADRNPPRLLLRSCHAARRNSASRAASIPIRRK